MSNHLGEMAAAQGSPSLDALKTMGQNLVPNQIRTLVSAIPVTIAADATGGLVVPAPFACKVIDVIVQSSGASSSGTVLLSNGTNAVSDAIIMAVDKVVTRAGTLDPRYASFAAGDDMKFTTHAAGDRGFVNVIVTSKEQNVL